jgi:hypothetical protein
MNCPSQLVLFPDASSCILERDLVGFTTSMLREPTFTSKNPPSIGFDENVANFSTSTSY